MNNWLNKMESKFGKYAIPNLTLILIGCYIVGYALQMINPNAAEYMKLEPGYILRGQVWRLITWIVMPPYTMSMKGFGIFFTVIMMFFYFSIGNTLERTWGTFRYNVYIFGGMLFTLIAAFVCYFVFSAIAGGSVQVGDFFTTYYVMMSMFLGFAATFPDAKVYLYFIIPLKVKWLGVLYFALMVYECGQYFHLVLQGGIYYWVPIIAFIASMMNFFIFFFSTRDFGSYSPVKRKRQKDFDRQMDAGRRQFSDNVRRVRNGEGRSEEEEASEQMSGQANPYGSGRKIILRGFDRTESAKTPRHRCEICGRTELDDPNLEFRFCTKCSGSHEYCMEHLFTHVHKSE
ncbi:MAG: hypothetical protein Q4A32_03760 [Lachnospiraceae bacterium]|nr:hypothetical protein [Lachnospiraceae bacterium]